MASFCSSGFVKLPRWNDITARPNTHAATIQSSWKQQVRKDYHIRRTRTNTKLRAFITRPLPTWHLTDVTSRLVDAIPYVNTLIVTSNCHLLAAVFNILTTASRANQRTIDVYTYDIRLHVITKFPTSNIIWNTANMHPI